MHKKVKPTGKQISMLLVHLAVFALATAASWMLYDKPSPDHHWAYPWPAWTTAAWALAILGHFCIVFTSYNDKGYDTYRQQQGKI
jgi:2TM domain